MKKILFGLEATEGGALKHLLYLVTNIDKKKFEVTVLLSTLRNPEVNLSIDNLRLLGITTHIIHMTRSISLWSDLRALICIHKVLRSNHFDIIHAHSSKAGALLRISGRINKIPLIIYTPHCFYFQGQTGIKKLFYFCLEKMLSSLCHQIIVSKNEEQAALSSKLCSSKKLIVINNAIKFSDYTTTTDVHQLRHYYSIPANATVIGTVARIEKQKNIELFLEVANTILHDYPNALFVITGNGSRKDKIVRMIRQLGLQDRVLLTGYIDRVQHIYEVIDIFLTTSRWEGSPYVVLEAAYFRKPIVSTFSTEFSFAFTETVVSEDTKTLLIEKIRRLIESRQLVKIEGTVNRERLIREYSFLKFIERHEDVYNKAISRQ